MNTGREQSADKVGETRPTQDFQILADIARELAGTVVFPTSFDAALRLRKELQNPDLPTARIASIVGVEPLIATKLIRLAGSALYSPDGTPAKDLRAAISRRGVELVRTTALTIAMNQLMRSRDMCRQPPRQRPFRLDASGYRSAGRRCGRRPPDLCRTAGGHQGRRPGNAGRICLKTPPTQEK